jgi:phosphatidylserine/phosphatidylglycerophosphate/cardiolipin synthase-like enzyme
MTQPRQTFFTDDEVASQILKIIRQAKESVTIVSPYFEYWGHAVDSLVKSLKDGVAVSVIVRNDQKVVENPQIIEIAKVGIRVLAVDRLHAKIYLNENDVLISSMNFTNYSTQNSREIALLIQDKQTEKEVRSYVENSLVTLSKSVTAPTLLRQVVKGIAQMVAWKGNCIRCGRAIEHDPDHPLCDDCYPKWAVFKNEDYQEKFCHICGKPNKTSYAKPLCTSCYNKSR